MIDYRENERRADIIKLRRENTRLHAERDEKQRVVSAYRLALLAVGIPATVLDEIANGALQEAKNE